ncbi:unnamed protein product [Ectocarpus sp. 12 AP-2014]
MTEISRPNTTSVSTRQRQYLFRDRVLEMFSKRESKGKRHYGPNHLIAGTTAGVVTTAALYPLDLVKTRYQARTRGRLVYDKGPSPYKSLGTAFRTIIREEGARALYQGLGPALLGNAVAWGGFFYCYEKIKNVFRARVPQEADLGTVHHLGAGYVAGAMMVLATNPVWMIKTRMQLQDKKAKSGGVRPYSGLMDAVRTITREEGPLALYKGAVPALMLCGQGAVQFAVYEWLKARVPKRNENTPQESLLMGGASKILSTLVTYPTQVIKSRLQQRGTAEETQAGSSRYRGTLHCASEIGRKEGVRGFFKGCVAHAVRAAPASAITFVVYEEVLKALA